MATTDFVVMLTVAFLTLSASAMWIPSFVAIRTFGTGLTARKIKHKTLRKQNRIMNITKIQKKVQLIKI